MTKRTILGTYLNKTRRVITTEKRFDSYFWNLNEKFCQNPNFHSYPKYQRFQDIGMYNVRPNRPRMTTPEHAVIGS